MVKRAAHEIICVLIGLSAMSAFLVSCATPAASPGIASSGQAPETRQTRRASNARGDKEGFDWSLVQKVCVVDVAELDQSDEIGMMISHHLFEDGVSATSARAESVEGVRAAAEQAQAEVLIYGTVTDAATLRDADGFPPTPTRKIDIELRLVETETGKTLWEATYSGSDKARTKDEYIIGESVEHVLIKTAPFWELMPRVPAETPLLAVGADAPAFEAKDIKGTSYSLDGNLKDNVVVLRFWYFSCDRCRQFLVELNGIHRRYNLSGASVIAVSLEKEPMSIQLKSRIYQDRLEYTFIADSFKSGSLETADAYMVSGKPAVYVIDRSGKIAFASAGDISAGDIGVAVASELNKK